MKVSVRLLANNKEEEKMPNWCHNLMIIEGGASEVKRFIDDNKGENGPLTFESLIPEPVSVGDGWCEWRLTNWGCKWDAGDGDLGVALERVSDECAKYEFRTPWSPPLPWALSASAAYSGVLFTLDYCCIEGDYIGEAVLLAGQQVHRYEEQVDLGDERGCDGQRNDMRSTSHSQAIPLDDIEDDLEPF